MPMNHTPASNAEIEAMFADLEQLIQADRTEAELKAEAEAEAMALDSL